ncbi:tRNA 2-thiouridine(34) synthase MnmA [Candidatus Kaiserbacteria bacterium]|nr:tRNA 2-thiouridine(34) synthase MnmA [Candidatus Kaiserbacteria bacterium]
MSNKKTVFVGLSGGVDSSVAAKRLIEQGYNVVGVFIKVWHPDFMVCNWEAERLDAMRVAAHLDIPFLTCDAEAEYRDEVAKYFIEEYKAGRTPNPDVMCNQHVKFDAFLRFAQQKGADFIATGHYAQKITKGNPLQSGLHRGVDEGKDQTYFLWTLSNEQLAKSLFPVGNTPKEQIRQEAEAAGIPTATKKDSQGICFLGHVDIPEFLSHYVSLEKGHVLNEAGEIIGNHQGALVYTLGQRHGFNITTANNQRTALYVTTRDLQRNTITVSAQKSLISNEDSVTLTNLQLRKKVETGDELEAQFRYRQKPFKIKILSLKDNQLILKPLTEVEQPASGQSCVLYQSSLCLGGGVVIK